MTAYADTSVLIAWFHPLDIFAPVVVPWVAANVDDFFSNRILEAELRHNLRSLKGDYAAIAWHSYRAAESRFVESRNKTDSLLAEADDLSVELAKEIDAGTFDFFHVAAARRERGEIFLTCDRAQAEVARTSGLKVHQFKISKRRA